MELFKSFTSGVTSTINSFTTILVDLRRGDNQELERDNVPEERDDVDYKSTFEGNSRKRRRPTPIVEEKQQPIIQQKQLEKLPTPISAYRDTSASDLSILSFSERPSPSTNATEPLNDSTIGNSIVDFTEAQWREQASSSKTSVIPQRPLLNGTQQLKKSLAKRARVSEPYGRRSLLHSDRINKRSSTPTSLRVSLHRQRTPLTDVTHGLRNTTLTETSSHLWQDPQQYSPPARGLSHQSPLRQFNRASPFQTLKQKRAFPTASRSARLQREIDRASASKKPWLWQQEPDAVIDDPEGLANFIKELQDQKVEGFENYHQVQERQKRIDAKLRELREPKTEVLRDISETSLQELHEFLGNRNQNYEARLIGGCPITPRNLKTLSGSQWLNDEVINGYMHLVKERANLGGKTNLILLNSMFVTTLKDHGYQKVSRWTKRAGAGGEKVLSLDGVIIPIHRNFHWTLAFINIKKKRFEYYDSLAGNWDPISLLRSYMEQEVGPKYTNGDWKDHYPKEKTPQQQNGVDCGVFLCKTAEVICRDGILSFSQKDIPKIRRMMQVELLKADLSAI